MSWQATAWAVRQKTGSSSRKVLLLVLANYADEHGICWPSQETLKAETEMSEDTIQRHSKVLKSLGLVKIVRRRRKDGTWPALLYQLNMEDTASIPQNAAWSETTKADANDTLATTPTIPHAAVTIPHPAADHAALTTATIPQSLRHKPSLEPSLRNPSLEPSPPKRRQPFEVRLAAFQSKQDGNEVIQHRIAKRLGPDGWEILQGITDKDLNRLTALERRGALDESTLGILQARWRAPRMANTIAT
jgi:hypothetical protein